MRHTQQRVRWPAARTAMVVALAASLSACAAPAGSPADANTARVFIDDQEMPTSYKVQCTQISWLWTIETEPETPGFTAIVQTGGTVEPKVMRIRDLTGFTGSAQAGAPDTQVGIDNTKFHFSGTAHGSFADRPTKPAEVRYRVEARC
ncbi:lipoprotein LpqH [Mycolicibacterium septicum]|uniref:lipoprotein LpqH n=1 Tax=Mycolicibacterium septicum TaxID=98668 RepID=UPI0023E11A80|nr:lipoprotein LpqH [Mycolicibacterium septicum]MDF3336096.1 lipoprotein LpqH [Mycolicibacterium septicum]